MFRNLMCNLNTDEKIFYKIIFLFNKFLTQRYTSGNMTLIIFPKLNEA